MPKFMPCHTVPAGALTREPVDSAVRPDRGFFDPAEGNVLRVVEAAGKEMPAAWFGEMRVPGVDIVPVGLEGDRGATRQA